MRRRDRSKASVGRAIRPACVCVFLVVMLAAERAASASAARARSGDSRLAPRARASIIGGHGITIETAPWQVAVVAFDPTEEGGEEVKACGGVIIGEQKVLTTAECIYNFEKTPTLPLAAADVYVVAGLASVNKLEAKTTGVRVSELEQHPYFEVNSPTASADDLAMLKLEKPLTLGTTENAIGLVGENAILPEGTNVGLAAFGEKSAPEEFGDLNWLGMTLTFPRRCGGEDDALYLCASTPTGSVCFGDFGSGLELPESPTKLAGITDYVQSEGACSDGALGFFANLAAPEISDWINEPKLPPPRAPRGGHAVIRGVLSVGHSLTCEPGSWFPNPTFTILFVDSAGSIILQAGSSETYQLTSADVGRTIYCEVRATTAGGTGFGRTEALEPIKPASSPLASAGPSSSPVAVPVAAGEPHGTITLPANRIQVKGSAAVVKLACHGAVACVGRLTLSAKPAGKRKNHAHSHPMTLGSVGFRIAGGEMKSVKLKLSGSARGLLAAGHGRLAATLSILTDEATSSRTQHKNVELIAQRTHR